MDTQSIIMIVGLCTLIVERIFSWAQKIYKIKCCSTEIDLERGAYQPLTTNQPPKDQGK